MKKSKQYHKTQDSLTPEQALQFLDDFTALVHGKDTKTQPISLRVPENVLSVFKQVCEKDGIKYQSQIVRLMREWLAKKTS